MKKRTVFLALSLIMLFACTACDTRSDSNVYEMTKSSYYDGTGHTDSAREQDYNKNLFYRNDRQEFEIADPYVLYVDQEDSPEYGYYYLYSTTGALFFLTYRSKDLVNWELMGKCYDPSSSEDDAKKATKTALYAPEVIYDEDMDKYIMFFSATPENSKNVVNLSYMATSDNPYGPFELVSSEDASRETSVTLSDGTTYEYNDYFAQYLYFDQAKIAKKVLDDFGLSEYQNSGYIATIDPHPFVDDDGEKYIYFSMNGGRNYIIGLKCIDGDWLNLDYDNMKLLTRSGYYEVDGSEINPAETASNYVNEGPTIVKHNDKYYLTMSINSYEDRSYAVIQAVSDSPLGEFRKLTGEEGGVLLSTDGLSMDLVSGPGHHSFIERDGQMYIIYHKHNNPETGGSARHVSMDRVEWITITDKNSEELDVMYCNGPTTTIMPLPDFASDYVNIADEATVTIDKNLQTDSSVSYVNDGLFSIYKIANESFISEYVRETVITDTATITLSFSDYRMLRAVMIYNSKDMSMAFKEIARIEMDAKDKDGNEITLVINKLAFDWTYNVYTDDPSAIREASSAFAEFNEISVKEVRITIDVPEWGWIIDENGNPIETEEEWMAFEHSNTVGISEIVLLGKRA